MPTDDSANSKSPKEHYSQEKQDQKIKGEGVEKGKHEKYSNLQCSASPAVVKAARTEVCSLPSTPLVMVLLCH